MGIRIDLYFYFASVERFLGAVLYVPKIKLVLYFITNVYVICDHTIIEKVYYQIKNKRRFKSPLFCSKSIYSENEIETSLSRK